MVRNRIMRVHVWPSSPIRVSVDRRGHTRDYRPTVATYRRLKRVLFHRLYQGRVEYHAPLLPEVSDREMWEIVV